MVANIWQPEANNLRLIMIDMTTGVSQTSKLILRKKNIINLLIR